MNIEGYTYLIYDKYTLNDHSFPNKCAQISLKDIMGIPNLETYEGRTALDMASITEPTEPIDMTFYKIYFFVVQKDIPINVLCIGINHNELNKNINSIPNKEFLINACSYHISYQNAYNNSIKTNINPLDKLNKQIINSNTDISDQIIESPPFTKINLFDFQRKTVKWMHQIETSEQTLNYSFNNEIFFGSYVYDAIQKEFIKCTERKLLKFIGGVLADEVGLGKTFQTLSLCLLNPLSQHKYFTSNLNRLVSRATLILCPNQLANQWIREISKTIKDEYGIKVVPLLTKTHHQKYSYMDLLDADFVIVSYNFLDNESYYDTLLKDVMAKHDAKKGSTYVKTSSFVNSQQDILKYIDKTYEHFKLNPGELFNKLPMLNLIHFHRLVCDEFHELFTVQKYMHVIKLLRFFSSTYKWSITGTPDKDNCIQNMIDYVSDYKLNLTQIEKIVRIDYINEYLTKKFIRRNTKQSIRNEYKLEPYDEKLIMLKFNQIERAMYNAYLANSNIDKFSVLIRQLCCDPRIANEIKATLGNCKTPEEIKNSMVTFYENAMSGAEFKVELIEYKIKKNNISQRIVLYKSQRKYLRQLDYDVSVEYPSKIYDPKYEKKLDENDEDEKDIDIDIDIDDDKDDKLIDKNTRPVNTFKEKITISENNQPYIKVLLKDSETKLNTKTYQELKMRCNILQSKLEEYKKIYEGKKSTYTFFNNMLIKLTKLTKQHDEGSDSDSGSDSGSDSDDEEKCVVCLNEITGDDVGVLKCGHIFCYGCIKQTLETKPKCPLCSKAASPKDLYMISYEQKKKVLTPEAKDKQYLIDKIGTKLANLILYIKSIDEKCIIFSQWDDLLIKVGQVLDTYSINNVFCRGNIWVRDKAIRDFTMKDNIKVCMLSSESAASGTNLTAASTVILLDPVYGTYEYRRNTEWQAIGRAYRMGQTKKVTVVRFIIKDTVEDEILKLNLIEDVKFKDDTVSINHLIELTDENISTNNIDIGKLTADADSKAILTKK